MKKNDLETSRVSLNFPNKVIKRVKEYAKEQGIPDTSAYILLLNSGLMVDDYFKEFLKKIGDNNEKK